MPRRLDFPAAFREWIWAVWLVCSLVALAVFALLLPSSFDRIGLILSSSSAIAVAVGIYLHEPERRNPWWLLALGQLLFALGELASGSSGHAPISPAAVTPGDLMFLAGYPVVAAGFALMVAHRNPGPGYGVVLDGGILTVGVALVAWTMFADPMLAMPGLGPLERLVDVAHLIGDIALIGVVATLVLDEGIGSTSLRLFALSVTTLLLADGLSADNPTGLLATVGKGAYFAQYVLWAAAALHPSLADTPAIASSDRRMTPRRLVAMATAALVAPAVLTAEGIVGHIDFPAISLASVTTVALVIAAMAALVREQSAEMQNRLTLESALRETSETLRAILDSAPLPIVVVDRQRRVLFWSRSAEMLFGYTADEAQGRRLPILAPDEPDRTLVARILAGETMTVADLACTAKDGQIIKVRAHLAPIKDEAGKVRSAITLMEDTSEVDLLKDRLAEAQKLDTVGRLAGGIAHDFNNILTAVIGFAELSLEEAPGTDVTEYLTGIRDAAERAAGLTQQLLAFSRRQILQPQVLDVNEVVGGLESMLRRLIGEQIQLRIVPDAAAGCLRADRTQLEQVILNLALNGRDAMPDGGLLEISTGHQKYRSGTRSRPLELAPGEYATISVKDTGLGMDAQTRDHIFEPFFTTKGQGRGTGLGLATAYGIIMQSEGFVTVESAPGEGTTLRLFFPSAAPQPVVGEPTATPAPRRTGRILLVEDEPVLRGIAQRVLVRAGFDVTSAADPGEAIIAAETMPEPFDLLLTDVVMPGMRGPELARRLRNSRPGLRVLLASGYAEEIVDSDRHEDPLLAKPFSPETLLAAVDAVMGPAETRSESQDDQVGISIADSADDPDGGEEEGAYTRA